jgi:hypothetical protein
MFEIYSYTDHAKNKDVVYYVTHKKSLKKHKHIDNIMNIISLKEERKMLRFFLN